VGSGFDYDPHSCKLAPRMLSATHETFTTIGDCVAVESARYRYIESGDSCSRKVYRALCPHRHQLAYRDTSGLSDTGHRRSGDMESSGTLNVDA
jgi:hypothetical protein